MNELNYLTNMPQSMEEFGMCKTPLVRREMVHLKHIFTEIFVRRSIDLKSIISQIDMSTEEYMEYMTNRMRSIFHFSRRYSHEINDIVKLQDHKFFDTVSLYKGLSTQVLLDFDGVTSKKSFWPLYELCTERFETSICSANPGIKPEWFKDKGLTLPHRIHSCKGKINKFKRLIELNKYKDMTFFLDNEEKYLIFAWIFGIKTYIFQNNKIKLFTLNTK